MVAIIENWSKIEGVVNDIVNHPKMEGYIQVKVHLQKSRLVKGFPNLAQQDEQSEVYITMPEHLATAIKKGGTFKKVVRKVFGQEYFMKLPKLMKKE